jgi:putative transposase
VRAVLYEPRFADRSPAEVFATLLDEKKYFCSERTMYRLLAEGGESRERRHQRRHPVYTKPELVSTAPNEVWSWDITKLLGPRKWTYYYLYVLLDLYSRYAVGWMVADRENATLASNLIEETCRKYEVNPKTLTLHSDRGAPMTAKCTAQLLADLGVTRSLSRPRVSDDNPFSEAQFKTLKYHPGFPGRFEGQEVATNYCRSFFPWYNHHHRHGGIAMLTPADVYFGRADDLLADRQKILANAYQTHPERFPRGRPQPAALPEAVYINPPRIDAAPTGGAH